jgi:hypothetical protein
MLKSAQRSHTWLFSATHYRDAACDANSSSDDDDDNNSNNNNNNNNNNNSSSSNNNNSNNNNNNTLAQGSGGFQAHAPTGMCYNTSSTRALQMSTTF